MVERSCYIGGWKGEGGEERILSIGEERSGHRSGIIGHEICIGKSREPLKSSGLKGGFIYRAHKPSIAFVLRKD